MTADSLTDVEVGMVDADILMAICSVRFRVLLQLLSCENEQESGGLEEEWQSTNVSGASVCLEGLADMTLCLQSSISDKNWMPLALHKLPYHIQLALPSCKVEVDRDGGGRGSSSNDSETAQRTICI